MLKQFNINCTKNMETIQRWNTLSGLILFTKILYKAAVIEGFPYSGPNFYFFLFWPKLRQICEKELFLDNCSSANPPTISFIHVFFLIVILFKWLFMRNLATILPLKSKLSGIFQRFNAMYGSIAMLKIGWISSFVRHFTRP